MMLWIRLALRNMTRNFRRTGLTAATIVAGTALLTLGLSWVGGLFNTMIADYTANSGHIRLVDADFAAREALQPLYENVADSAPVIAAIKQSPGVIDAQARITTGVLITANEEIGDNFTMLMGASDEYYRQHLRGQDKLVKGTWLTNAGKQVVIGRKLATQIKADIGSKLLMLGQDQNGSMSPLGVTVVGVIGGNAMVDQQAFVSLEDARSMLDLPGGAMEILVWASSEESRVLVPIADQLATLPAVKGLVVQPWNSREPWATSLKMVGAIDKFIKMLIIFVASLAIFNTMTMSVLERTTEIGVLRAMGLSRLGTVSLFVMEGAAIGLMGGVTGALLGSIPAYYLQVHGFSLAEDLIDKAGTAFPLKTTVYAQLTPQIFEQAILVGLVIAILGAIFPALRAAAIPPVAAMRARR